MQNRSIQQDALVTQNGMNFNQFFTQIWPGNSRYRFMGCVCEPLNVQPHAETKVFVRSCQGLSLLLFRVNSQKQHKWRDWRWMGTGSLKAHRKDSRRKVFILHLRSRNNNRADPQATKLMVILILSSWIFGPGMWTIGTVCNVIFWLSQWWIKANDCSPERKFIWMFSLL